MRVITSRRFKEAAEKYHETGKQLTLLDRDLKRVNFESLNQVKDFFAYVSLLKDNRVVSMFTGINSG